VRTLLSSSVAEVTKIFGGDLAEEEKRYMQIKWRERRRLGRGGPCVQQGERKSHLWREKNVIL